MFSAIPKPLVDTSIPYKGTGRRREGMCLTTIFSAQVPFDDIFTSSSELCACQKGTAQMDMLGSRHDAPLLLAD